MSKIKERKKNYKYKIYNAEICLVCGEFTQIFKDRRGFKACICKKCWEEKQEMFKQFAKHGTYIVAKEQSDDD